MPGFDSLVKSPIALAVVGVKGESPGVKKSRAPAGPGVLPTANSLPGKHPQAHFIFASANILPALSLELFYWGISSLCLLCCVVFLFFFPTFVLVAI